MRFRLNRKRSHFVVFALLGSFFAPVIADQSDSDVVRVAVAANFYDTLNRLAEDFERQYENRKILVSKGSSGGLYAQISQGAPYELFFSADANRPKMLYQNNIAVDEPFTYAIGQLVVWSSDHSVETDLSVRVDALINHVAIADPEVAPYGVAALELFADLGIENIEQKLVRGSSVSQAFQYVASGNAEIGVVSLAQLMQFHRVNDTPLEHANAWLPSLESYPRIEQQAVKLSERVVVDQFVEYLQSSSAQSIIQADGYVTESANP